MRAGQHRGERTSVAVRQVPSTPGSVLDGLARDWHAPFPVSLRLTLLVHRHGPADPTLRIDNRGAIWRTSLTPDGPGTLRLALAQPEADDRAAAQRVAVGGVAEGRPTEERATEERPPAGRATVVRAAAWGPGASWLLDTLPDLLGAGDDPAAFQPDHPRLRDLARRLPGLRISRTGRVLEALVPAVLEQKVVGVEAQRAWRQLLTWYGSPAPGPAPAGMRVFPAPATWQDIPSWDWHRSGVEAVRARTIASAARMASRLETICSLPGADGDRVLRSLPGIGPWTSAEARQRACGDADAVSVGDYHIPALVGWNLAGQITDDAGMLELLAPFAGQRYRVTRLIELGGHAPPRRGPRMSARDYRAI